MTTPSITRVELHFLRDRVNHWLRFGMPAAEQIIDRRRRTAEFASGQRFAYIRWQANDYGTELWRLYVLQAGQSGDILSTIPGITLGAEILLRLDGGKRVKQALATIAAIEQAGIDPAAVAPEYWRHLHNRIFANLPFRTYGPEQHGAWLLRQRVSA
jgi:hypothetical protein